MSRERQRPGPSTYLITFTCYGTHLHGREGTVDRKHNIPNTPALTPDTARLKLSLGAMKDEPYELDADRRRCVLKGIQRVCSHRGWTLIAAQVRTNHVHVVVSADRPPEDVMLALKAYASRALNESGFESKDRRRWTHHGSTRWLRDRDAVERAVRYVIDAQGEPMEVYRADW